MVLVSFLGVFVVGAFFLSTGIVSLAEIGDKTQIATVALVAEYQQYWAVVLGTTLGMMVVNAPTVFVGDKLSGRLSLAWVHRASAAIFLVLAIVAISRALSMG